MQPPARQEHLRPEAARWLVNEGRTAISELVAASSQPIVADLRTTEALRRSGLDMDQAAAVITAAAARQRLAPLLARTGWPATAEVILSAAAAEQSSHPVVAWHRAARFPDHAQVIDFGCGAGIDAIAIARNAAGVNGVDVDEARIILARHNAEVAAVGATFEVGRIEDRDTSTSSHWHADPGRRTGGRRARALAETEPPVATVLGAAAGLAGGALVVSPGVALDDPDLPDGELEFVQVGHDLVEGVLWVGDLRHPDATATATRVDLSDTGLSVVKASRAGPAPNVPLGGLRAWLLDPEPAAARARLHHHLVLEAGGHRLSEHRALCTADRIPADPWWRAWEVEAELPGRPRDVRSWLAQRDDLPLSIQLHGSTDPVERWWSGLGRLPRGPIGRRIHVVQDGPTVRAIVTRHASLSQPVSGR